MEAPCIAPQRFGDAPAIGVAATIDQVGRMASVFIVHRGQTETLKTELVFIGPKTPARVLDVQQIWGLDPKAANSFERPDVVVPRQVAAMPFKDGRLPIKLPPLSLSVVQLAL